MIRLATWSSIGVPRKIMFSFNSLEYMSYARSPRGGLFDHHGDENRVSHRPSDRFLTGDQARLAVTCRLVLRCLVRARFFFLVSSALARSAMVFRPK